MAKARLRLRRKLMSLGHRFDRIRAFSMTVSLAILVAVPLLGIARFDAWRGNHWVLGNPSGPIEAAVAVLAGIVILYIITFASNFFAARMFCGWGCPVGQISRFGEGVEIAAGKSLGARLGALIKGGAFGGAFVVSMMAWWVDLRVFWSGTPREIAVASGALGFFVLGSYLHGRFWRWQFCRQVCPIGLYYSVVAPTKSYGILFQSDLGTCIQCEACETVCPVELDPRDLLQPRDDVAGLAMGGLPSDNHCLRCGDCVSACEFVLRKSEVEVPLHFGVGVHGRPLTSGDDTPLPSQKGSS